MALSDTTEATRVLSRRCSPNFYRHECVQYLTGVLFAARTSVVRLGSQRQTSDGSWNEILASRVYARYQCCQTFSAFAPVFAISPLYRVLVSCRGQTVLGVLGGGIGESFKLRTEAASYIGRGRLLLEKHKKKERDMISCKFKKLGCAMTIFAKDHTPDTPVPPTRQVSRS